MIGWIVGLEPTIDRAMTRYYQGFRHFIDKVIDKGIVNVLSKKSVPIGTPFILI